MSPPPTEKRWLSKEDSYLLSALIANLRRTCEAVPLGHRLRRTHPSATHRDLRHYQSGLVPPQSVRKVFGEAS